MYLKKAITECKVKYIIKKNILSLKLTSSSVFYSGKLRKACEDEFRERIYTFHWQQLDNSLPCSMVSACKIQETNFKSITYIGFNEYVSILLLFFYISFFYFVFWINLSFVLDKFISLHPKTILLHPKSVLLLNIIFSLHFSIENKMYTLQDKCLLKQHILHSLFFQSILSLSPIRRIHFSLCYHSHIKISKPFNLF